MGFALMKKWLLIIAVILLIIISFALYIFWSAQADQFKNNETAQQFVQQQFDWQIIDTNVFHGNEKYWVFTMLDGDDKYYYLYVDEQFETLSIEWSNIHISPEKIREQIMEDFPDVIAIKQVIPALSNDRFAWEAVANDERGHLQYIYYAMDNGSFLRRYIIQ